MNRTAAMKSAALLVLSLAAGLGLGWRLRSGDDAELSSSSGVKNAATTGAVLPDRPGRPQTAASGPVRTLATVEKEIIPKGGLPAEARAAIAAMKTENLQSLMVQITKEKLLPDRSAGRAWQDGLLNAAAQELCRRDLPGSLAWGMTFRALRQANSIVSFKPIGVDCILPQLVQASSKLDVAATIAWMHENGPQDWSEKQPGDIAYTAAVANGAEATLKAEYNSTGDVTLDEGFPEGFDFARLISGTKKQVVIPLVADYWAGIDPEAAYACLHDQLRSQPYFWSGLLMSVAMTRGDDEAAAWLGGKLKELPEEERLKALQRLGCSSPAAVEAIMGQLDNDQERLAYAGSTLNSVGGGADPHRPDIRALELLGSEDLQVQALERYVQSGGNIQSILRSRKLPAGVMQRVKGIAPQ